MKSITSKLVVGILASLAAVGMTGGPAFADATGERQRQVGYVVEHPQSVAGKVFWRVSYARAAAVNVAGGAQRQALDVVGKTH